MNNKKVSIGVPLRVFFSPVRDSDKKFDVGTKIKKKTKKPRKSVNFNGKTLKFSKFYTKVGYPNNKIWIRLPIFNRNFDVGVTNFSVDFRENWEKCKIFI